jgi:anti-anti-sigma regulatory factor
VDLEIAAELASEPRIAGFKRFVEHHYLDDGIDEVIIHLDPLQWISLEGVGALVSLRRESEKVGKVLTVHGAQGQVAEKLRIAGVLHYLEDADPPQEE